jgi:hypothetical protein
MIETTNSVAPSQYHFELSVVDRGARRVQSRHNKNTLLEVPALVPPPHALLVVSRAVRAKEQRGSTPLQVGQQAKLSLPAQIIRGMLKLEGIDLEEGLLMLSQ